MKDALMNGIELMRIGFIRINFNYFANEDETDYILNALEFICKHGWMLLPHYKFDIDTGVWINRDESEIKLRSWLGEIDYSSGSMQYLKSTDENLRGKFPFFMKENCVKPVDYYMEKAYEYLIQTVEQYSKKKSMVDQKVLIPEEYQYQIWFVFPSDVI